MSQRQSDKMLASETISQRESDKMLATESTYSSEDEIVEQSTSQPMPIVNGQSFDFEHDGFPWRDINVRRSDGSMAYFADISVFTRNVPDIVLHADGKDGPTVAVAHFSRALSIKCGLGSNDLSMNWIEMKRSGMLGSTKYQFEHDGRRYSLRRTKDGGPGVSGISRVLLSHYEVIDDSSGNVLASYDTQASIGKRKGVLNLAPGVDQQLEILIVLGIASWREKARRRHASGGGNAGGIS